MIVLFTVRVFLYYRKCYCTYMYLQRVDIIGGNHIHITFAVGGGETWVSILTLTGLELDRLLAEETSTVTMRSER